MRGLAALALLGGVCHSGKLLLPPLLLAILILAMLLHLSLLNQLRTPDYTVTVATAPFLIPPLSSLSPKWNLTQGAFVHSPGSSILLYEVPSPPPSSPSPWATHFEIF